MTTYNTPAGQINVIIPDGLKRMDLFTNVLACNHCDRMWKWNGKNVTHCPYCGGDDIEPMWDEEAGLPSGDFYRDDGKGFSI